MHLQSTRIPLRGNNQNSKLKSMNKYLVTSCLLALASSQLTQAITFNISGAVGGAPTGVNYLNFDDLTLGSQAGTTTAGPSGSAMVTTTSDAKAVLGSLSGQYAAPFLSGGNGAGFGNANGVDRTTYMSTGIGGVSLDFGGSQQYIGLLWGSIDLYNSLEFYQNNVLLGSITGGQVLAGANGDQGVNGTLYVNISTDMGFDRVVAKSSQYAFEFDNVAYTSTALPSPVPDGGALAGVFSLALIGMAGVARRCRQS